ncbi:MAG: 50S ribosomal protein L13 [Candidatus Woesearchaeota archaeon]
MIIDGKNAVLGRLGTVVAKKALLGEDIVILNAQDVVVSGSPDVVLARYARLKNMGTPRKGPFYSSRPEIFLKRVLRGMLPYKQEKGRVAYERIKCYVGVPQEFAGKEMQSFGVKDLQVTHVTISEICKHIGGKQ